MLEPTVNTCRSPVLGQALPVIHAVTSDEIVARADFLDVACARDVGARGRAARCTCAPAASPRRGCRRSPPASRRRRR